MHLGSFKIFSYDCKNCRLAGSRKLAGGQHFVSAVERGRHVKHGLCRLGGLAIPNLHRSDRLTFRGFDACLPARVNSASKHSSHKACLEGWHHKKSPSKSKSSKSHLVAATVVKGPAKVRKTWQLRPVGFCHGGAQSIHLVPGGFQPLGPLGGQLGTVHHCLRSTSQLRLPRSLGFFAFPQSEISNFKWIQWMNG